MRKFTQRVLISGAAEMAIIGAVGGVDLVGVAAEGDERAATPNADHLPAKWAEGRGFLPCATRSLTGADARPA